MLPNCCCLICENVWNIFNSASGYDSVKKIWVLDESDLEDAGYTANGKKSNFTFTFDFTSPEFGIKTDFTGADLTAQSFIICAIDQQGLSRTEQVTLKGDTNKPTLSIDKVVVYSSYTSETDNQPKQEKSFYNQNDQPVTPVIDPYNRGSANAITDLVQLRGSWSEESDYIKIPETITWSNYTGTIQIHKNSDGSWYSEPIIPPDKTTSTISMTVKDLGGNRRTASASFSVDGNVAQFLRISSDNSDKNYGPGQAIDIYIEFSKAVTYSGGTAGTKPSLILSNGATATYLKAEENKHVFRYTVASSDTDDDGLYVKNIKMNGHKWKDGSNTIWLYSAATSQTSPVGTIICAVGDITYNYITSNLNANRTIGVDTTAPSLDKIEAITNGGYYKAGSVLYFKGTFSEDMQKDTINTANLSLKFKTSSATTGTTTGTTTETKAIDNKTVQFSYTVKSTDNIAGMSLAEIVWGSTKPKDIAGNDAIQSSSLEKEKISDLKLDNTSPDKPVITITPTLTGAGNTKVIYDDTAQVQVSVSYDVNDPSGSKQYTTDYKTTGSIWKNYTAAETISQNGPYTIRARHQDAAGNAETLSNEVKFIIDKGHILKSIKANKAEGTYGLNEEIKITLNFRNEITVTNPKITLNVGNSGKVISGSNVTDTKTLSFTYKVASGDNVSKLQVTGLSGTFKDVYGNEINDFVTVTDSSVEKFDTTKTIAINTNAPYVTGVSLLTKKRTDLSVGISSS